ncbi:MAG TPA: chromosomal replication initiator protein DnaA [Desulfobacteraceae bacterium]|nr:chromosomal replication initiator protein DnaA [Desulfobacteraceae bacterium]
MMPSWEKIRRRIRERIPEHCYRMWIEPVALAGTGPGSVTLASPNAFMSRRLETVYLPVIREALAGEGLAGVRVRFTAQAGGRKADQGKAEAAPEPAVVRRQRPVQQPLPGLAVRAAGGRVLKESFTFDRFVRGKHSEFAFYAARAMARDEAGGTGVLYLSGKTGLGKTHLAQAAGQAAAQAGQGARVVYATAEDFTNELVASLKGGTVARFKDRYRTECDFLILEDVHFLTGKEATQKELAAAFDYLLDADKKLVFSGGMGPDDIPGLNDRLRSRLSMGLAAGIGAPDFETRAGILRDKARGLDVPVPGDVVSYIAEEIEGDVRRLESALFSVAAKARFAGLRVDMALARSVVEPMPRRQKRITAGQITDLVCRAFPVTREELVSRSRKQRVVKPRQLAMFLARQYTDLPLKEIGRAFNRYHATVVHAVNAVEKEIRQRGVLYEQAGYLGKQIEQGRTGPGRAA